jgi:hypothetical protein
MSDSPFMGPAFTPEIDPTVAFPQVVEIPAPRVQLAESSWLHSRGKRFFDLVFTALVLPFVLPFFLPITCGHSARIARSNFLPASHAGPRRNNFLDVQIPHHD